MADRNPFPIIAVAVAIATAVGVFAGVQKPAVLPPMDALDYANPSAWAARPAKPTAAVWEKGWDIDVFLISAEGVITNAPPAEQARQVRSAAAKANERAKDLVTIGTVYAPLLRANALEQDIASALQSYAAADNRGRALFIAAEMPLPASSLSVLQKDQLLRQRFGGFLTPQGDAQRVLKAPDTDFSAFCPPEQAGPETCVHELPSGWMPNPLGPFLAEFRQRLNEDVPRLAPPLGPMEEIEIEDIRSPGDTDEARAKAAPN